MKILLVDDLAGDLIAYSKILQSDGHEVVTHENSETVLKESDEKLCSFDLAVIDWQMPRKNGVELGQELVRRNPGLFLVMLTAYSTVQREMEARLSGGFIHYIGKPANEELIETVRHLKSQVEQRQVLLASLGGADYGIIGTSRAIIQVKKLVTTVAPTDAQVLILGESGTGKELVAGALHNLSKRAKADYIRINCAAIPETLLESELFGHEKGAFTDARTQKIGRVEQANGGTIFLDEIADMSRPLQAKLLRFLEDGSFTRVGGTQELRVNVRLLAATNRDIIKAIREGNFREDLYYRLNVVQFRLPPLREREGDVLLLAQYFLNNSNKETGKSIHGLSPEAQQSLCSHKWPGNVRELRNAIERAVIVETSNIIRRHSLPDFDYEMETTGMGQPGSMPSAVASKHRDAQPHDARRDAVARATLFQWDSKIGDIWTAKIADMTTPDAKAKIKVTTDELGALLQKTGGRAETAKEAGKRLENSGAAVRQAYDNYRKEMRQIVHAESELFPNLHRLKAWKRWFGDLFDP